MQKINNIEDFVSYENQSVHDVLKKIDKNKRGIVFLINSSGELTGSFSDGDFRRTILEPDNFNQNSPVCDVMNKKVIFIEEGDSSKEILGSYKNKGLSLHMSCAIFLFYHFLCNILVYFL